MTIHRMHHVGIVVDDLAAEVVSYGGSYRLCYIRGPEGIIVELGEPIA